MYIILLLTVKRTIFIQYLKSSNYDDHEYPEDPI